LRIRLPYFLRQNPEPSLCTTSPSDARLSSDRDKIGAIEIAMPTAKKDKKDSNPNSMVCGNCEAQEGSANAPKLSACARCGLVVYCSRDCQKAHWKASHKQHCVAKADRAPQSQASQDPQLITDGDYAGKECTICLEQLDGASACTLPCTHVFHSKCVSELRKFGIQQACPLCRTELPPGPEKTFEEVTRRYMLLNKLVNQGKASWSSEASQRDVQAAITAWQASAKDGFAPAQYNLAISYQEGRGVKQSNEMAAQLFKKAANQGFAEAQMKLGLVLDQGRGIARSDAEAAQWFKKAAIQGIPEAQCNYGIMLKTGRGVARSDAEAAQWFKKSADQGFAYAYYNLGFLYTHGRGVAKNYVDAVRWSKKGANQGDVHAQYHMAILCSKGWGVAQSNSDAARWSKKAADQGHADAQYALGNLHFSGDGVTQNDREAFKYFQKAAHQGHAGGQCNLGIMYGEGRGVAPSDEEAVKWFKKSAAQGNQNAMRNLEMY